MNFKKLTLVFLVALPICVAARIFQIVYTIEYANGFYFNGKEAWGNMALIFIALICLALVILSLKTKGVSVKPPKSDAVLGIISLFVTVALCGEVFGEAMPMSMPAGQVFILKTTTVFTAVYFAVMSVGLLAEFKIPSVLHAIPCIYAIIKTIFTFINISSLALISDNILLMASYCGLMLFFINYGKLYNGIDVKTAFPKLAARGLAAAVICFTQSLSAIIIKLFSATPYTHINSEVLYSLLAFGLFITVFMFKSENKESE